MQLLATVPFTHRIPMISVGLRYIFCMIVVRLVAPSLKMHAGLTTVPFKHRIPMISVGLRYIFCMIVVKTHSSLIEDACSSGDSAFHGPHSHDFCRFEVHLLHDCCQTRSSLIEDACRSDNSAFHAPHSHDFCRFEVHLLHDCCQTHS